MPFDTERSKVAHLMRRAGFGYSRADLDALTSQGFAATLDAVLHPERVDDSATDAAAPVMTVDPSDKTQRQQIEPVKFNWVNRMLQTKRPLVEKMVLFWHGHFATANSKVNDAYLMQQQIQLFRDNALGSFETLLQKVTRDPAMLIWLDNYTNRKSAPNENYGREVMELFTLGIGNYTDEDVKQGARAYTGYGLDKNRNFVFTASQHDNGVKTFLGQTGNFDANDAIAIMVRQPAHATFMATELFTFFVHDHPSTDTIARLASVYTNSNFNIGMLMAEILGGPEFLSADAYHGVVKSPVDFVADTLKAFQVGNVGPDVTQSLRRMGQDLLNPPDVSGWKGGSAWISSTTLFERFNFVDRIVTTRGDATKPYFSDIPNILSTYNATVDQGAVSFFSDLLVDNDLTPEAQQALVNYVDQSGSFSLDPKVVDLQGRGVAHLAASLPTHQLA